jgi:hypothetical protein
MEVRLEFGEQATNPTFPGWFVHDRTRNLVLLPAHAGGDARGSVRFVGPRLAINSPINIRTQSYSM